MKLRRLLFFVVTIVSCALLQATRSHVEAKVHFFVQEDIDEGDEFVREQKFAEAIRKYRSAVEWQFRFLAGKPIDAGKLEQRSDEFPSYVLKNMALASERRGDAALVTASYYRAYLAFDPKSKDKGKVRSRIIQLEKQHAKPIVPLCNAAATRLRLVSHRWGSEDWLTAKCIETLVIAGRASDARRLEKEFRQGLFKERDCINPRMLDVGYGSGYAVLGDQRKAELYFRKAREPIKLSYTGIEFGKGEPHVIRCSEETEQLAQWTISQTASDLEKSNQEWTKYINRDLIKHRTAEMWDWFDFASGGGQSTRGWSVHCGLLSLDSQLAEAARDKGNYDSYASSVKVKELTCIANELALYQLAYERRVAFWEEHSYR